MLAKPFHVTLAGGLVAGNDFMEDQINKLADGVWPLVAL